MKNHAEKVVEHINNAQSIIHVLKVAASGPEGIGDDNALETSLRIAQNELTDAYEALGEIIEPTTIKGAA